MMVEEREGEERSNSGSSADAPLPPVKEILNGVKQKVKKFSASSLDRYPLRLRNPDLSNCHVCNSQISCKRGKDKLQTLDSQWRIVIICNSCFKNVQSAKVCSYCFTEISELGITCRFCNRRVHHGCMSMYRQLNSWSDTDSFTCIDCWIPRSLKKIGRKGTSRIASKSSSSRVPSFSSNLKECSMSLENAAKDAKSAAEVKVANAAVAREKAMEKAVAARQATEMAANALDLAVAAATEESQVDGSCPDVDDAKLALRLHRAINSSPRIFRNVGSIKLDCFANPKKLEVDNFSLSRHSNLGNQIVSDLEVRTDNLILGNHDKAASVPSLQMVTFDHGSSNDLGSLEPTKMESRGSPEEGNRNSKIGRLVNSKVVSEVGHVIVSDCQDCTVDPPMKEEQASCSSKVSISSGNYNSTNSGSQFSQNQEGLNHNIRLMYRRTRYQSVYEKDSFVPETKISHEPDMFRIKYRRRFRGHNMYTRTYSRRHTNLKGLLEQNTSSYPNTFHLESQSSGTTLSLMQVNNTEVLTSQDTSQHRSVHSQDSTPASSLS